MSPHYVLVLAEHPLLHTTIGALLEATVDLAYAGAATQFRDLVAQYAGRPLHVLVVGGDVVASLAAIAATLALHWPDARLIVLVDDSRHLDITRLRSANVSGCLLQSEVDETLVYGIRAALRGAKWSSWGVVEVLFSA